MENKETIKHRMYKNAARLWDVKNIENLDPLIKLLIEALSSDIYKLSTEINSIEIRLMERIAQLLTPDMLIIPQPSHMIISSQPIEDTVTIDKMNGFLFDQPHKGKVSGGLSFHPTGRFSLIKGYVRGIVCGRSFYTVDTDHNKDMLAQSSMRSEVFNNSIWIGLDVDKQIRNLKNLSFFIDYPNAPELKNDFLPLLSFTQWSYNGNSFKTATGIHIADKDNNADAENFFEQYDLLNMLDTKILNSYNQHFITIKEDVANDHDNYQKIPAEVVDLFAPKLKDAIQLPLLWIKVEFPPNFRENILADTTVSINSFPIANKALRSLFSKSKKMANIIPLSTAEKEYFLSVNSVKDEYDNSYNFLPYTNESQPNFGTYSIKRGGVERFDTRDAKEYISNLTDLLRDESVAFSMLGKEYLRQSVEDIKTKIAGMEQKLIDTKQNKEVSSYIVVDAEDDSESLFIDYWTTNCEYANNIKTGTVLKPDLSLSVNHATTQTLTTSLGGRSIPKSNNRLDMYKYILTTRERIFTTEDVVNFCYAEFGDYFSLVEVKKGVQVSNKPKEGLIRTIDIYVTMKTEFGTYSESKQGIKSRLLRLLNEKSPDTFNYRIIIQNK